MCLLAVGLNHKTAPVEIRERVTFAPGALRGALKTIKEIKGVKEATILSTCNRTEIYCGLDKPSEHDIIQWFRDYHHLKPSQFDPYLFRLFNRDAVRHLLRVSCGLDSLIVGEPQILGQLKAAYQEAYQTGAVGNQLNKLFQHAFSVAKQVRTDTAIGSSPVSVAFAAVSLAKQIFGDLGAQSALLIGAGDTVELTLRHLYSNNIGTIIIANRTPGRARILAEPYGGAAISLTAIPNALPSADITISSTASPLPILGKGAVERALKIRKHRPMFMVDIAVPRDIEPEVGHLDDVFLYTVDDLKEVIQENLESRREAAAQAEEIIEAQVERFMNWLRARDSARTIKAYRQKAESIQREVRNHAQQLLAQGRSSEEVLDYLAHTLMQKLLHDPTVRLRQAGEAGHQEVIEIAREIFALEDPSP